MEKKTVTTVRLKPEVQELLAQFQGNYQAETKKRISQSEVINKSLLVFIASVYKEWNKAKESK